MTKEKVERAKIDPKLREMIGLESGFSHADFFHGLDSLARFLDQNRPGVQSKNKSKIEALEKKLDPKNPESYQNSTKEIYHGAYEASRENLVFLTEDLGLDGIGQEFLDGLLNTLNSRLTGKAKIELSEKLTPEKREQIVEALNKLTKQDPPIFKFENGKVASTSSPQEKKKALIKGLSEQNVIVPPGNKLNGESLRQILGGKI